MVNQKSMCHWKYRARLEKLYYLHTGILTNCLPEKHHYKAGIQHFGLRTPQYNSAKRKHVLAVPWQLCQSQVLLIFSTIAFLLLQLLPAEINIVPEDKTQLQTKCIWCVSYLERDLHNKYLVFFKYKSTNYSSILLLKLYSAGAFKMLHHFTNETPRNSSSPSTISLKTPNNPTL